VEGGNETWRSQGLLLLYVHILRKDIQKEKGRASPSNIEVLQASTPFA